MKKGKLLRLLALIAMAAAIAVGSAGCSGCADKGKPDPDPAAGGYDVKYATTMPSGTDDGIMIDGKLDETAYAEQKTFVNRLSEDSDGNMERLSMTTYVGDKGWYVLTEVTDSALVYNGLLAPARNSTIHLYYELASENANEAIREIYMDAGRVYGRTPCNIGLMEYGVKVNGELNGATTGMTTELFIPWRAMGLTEKPENTDLLMYPMYSIPKGGGDYRNLSPLPNLSYVANQFYLFGSDGYSDKDASGAILGDAKNGHVKAGVWTYTDVEKTEADGRVTLSGSASVHAGSYAKTYIKDIVADNYVVEATVKVTGRDYGKRDGRAGLTVDIAGGKRKTLAAYISAEEGNAAGLNSVPFRSFYGDDYDGRNNRTETLPSVSLPEGGTLSGGVKLTLIKSGANLYGLANGEIILAETDNAIRGKCAFNLTAANVNAEFTDISYAVYDGDEAGMAAAIAGYGIRRISAEAEGYGNVYLDKIAVKDGGEVTLTVECGEDNVIKDIKINGEAVTDFAEKAEIFGTTVRYVLGNVTEDTNILVCFEEYAGVKVSGTISVVGESGLNMSDSVIYAFRADGSVIPFEGRVNEDGTYEISLPAGAYDKIRVNGAGYANDFDKIGGAAIVIGADPIENADFALETRIPTVVRHGEGNSVWTMTGDKEYTVSGMSHGNAWVEGNFGKAKNFAISTRVIAEKRAEVGVSLYGSYNGRNDFDVMVRVIAGGKMGISLYGWATGWAAPDDETCKVGKTYDPNDFRLTVVRNDDAVSVFVNDVFWKSYTGKITSNLDFSTMGEMRVGLAVRGLTGAVFRDYTFTEDQSAIEALVSRLANVATLDETDGSVVVEGITAGRANIGAEVKFSVTPASGKFIRVLADGKVLGGRVNADGSAVYTYRMGADEVNFTYDVKSAFAVSGTIPEDLADATVSVISDGTETVYNNALGGTDYSIVLPSGTYNIKFVGETREGMISGVDVRDTAIENVNLDKAYQKVTQQKNGGGAGAGKGEWTLTDNGVYSVSPLGDGDSYTLGVMGKAKNFVLSARIKGGSGKEVGVGLEYSGKNLMLIKVGSGTLVAFYTWQGGWSETKHPISWGSGNANDYTYTVIRKDNTMYALINGTLIGTFTGKINANHDLSAIGETEVGLLRRGNVAGEVTFSDYSFSTEQADIDAAITAVVDTGVWNDADGTLVVGGIENGKAKLGSDITFTVTPAAGKTVAILANGAAIPGIAGENGSTVFTYRVTGDVTFTYKIENIYAVSGSVPASLDGASLTAVSDTGRSFAFPAAVSGGEFSVMLPDGTYDLKFVGETAEGMISGVVVNGAAVENVNLDKAYIKPLNPQRTHGTAAQGTNTLTANGEYTIAAAGDGNSTNGLLFGQNVGDFVISTTVGGENNTIPSPEVGVQISYGNATDEVIMFMVRPSGNLVACYDMKRGWFEGKTVTVGTAPFRLTVARKDKIVYLFINGVFVTKYERTYTTDRNQSVDFAALDKVGVELVIRGTVAGTKFSEYSFSTEQADIDAAITAVVDTGVWNDAYGIRTVTGVTDGKAYLGDSVVITVTPQGNKIIKVIANGTALSGEINGDSYVYTYKVNSTAKITFSYKVTNLYAVSGNVTSDLSGATIKVTDTATGSATEYKSAVGAGGDYSIALPNGTYSLYVANDTHEGLIKSVVVGGAAVENVNLDKSYLKITEKGQYGGGSAEWELTDNGKYVVREQTTNEWQFTFGQIGVAEGDFVTRVRITGGEAAHVGVNLQAYDKLGNSSLFVMKVNDGIQFKGWGFGWNSDDSGYNYIKWKNADEKKDYYYTVVRYSGKLYVFIGDENESRLIRVFEGDIKGNERTVNTVNLGKLRIGFGIFGDSGKGSDRTVTFSEYSFSTEQADIQAEVNKVKYIAGTSAITDGTVTATDLTSGATYSGTVKDGLYSVAVDKDGKYKLYFASGTHEGLIPEVAEGVTEANLDEAYIKPISTQKVHGAGAKGKNELTANGEYTVAAAGDGNSANGIEFGAGINDFVLTSRVSVESGKNAEVGATIDLGGDNFAMFRFHTETQSVCIWGYAYGMTAEESGAASSSFDPTNFVYTLVRKGKTVYVFVDGTLRMKYSGSPAKVSSWGSGINLDNVGAGRIELGVRGVTGAKFSEYNFSTDSEDVDNAIDGVTYMSGSDSSGATDGTVTATDQSGATFTGTIKSGSYTITLHKDRTYNLRFVCGSKEGLISSVAVGETAVTQNFDSSKFGPKISWVEKGGRTITMHDTTAESSYGYTVSDNTNGDKAFGVMGSATGDFMISARVVNGKGRHIGIGMRYTVGNATKFLSFIKSGGGSEICAYDGQGWSTSTAVPGNWNIDNYTYTVVRKNNEIKVYVNNSPICTYSGTVKVTISSNADYTLSEIGTVEVGLALCWTKSNVATADTTSATFTDYSFSTDSTAIDGYIAARTA